MADDVIAMFEFAQTTEGIGLYSEKRYKLVPPKDVIDEDLLAYQKMADA
jgi:hypothetical protein